MLKGTNRFRKGATITAAAAAAVMATAGIAAASVAAPSITSPTTIVLLAHGGPATFVNVAHKTGPAIGDEVILKQPVFSPAHPTVVVGHGFVTVTFLGKNLTQDHATLVLRQGDIDLPSACCRSQQKSGPRHGTRSRVGESSAAGQIPVTEGV